jgi:hypothetical protein
MKNTCKALLVVFIAASTLVSSDAQAKQVRHASQKSAVQLAKAGAFAVAGGIATKYSLNFFRGAVRYADRAVKAKPDAEGKTSLSNHTPLDDFRHNENALFCFLSAYIAYKAFKHGYRAAVKAGLLDRPQAPVAHDTVVVEPQEVVVY